MSMTIICDICKKEIKTHDKLDEPCIVKTYEPYGYSYDKPTTYDICADCMNIIKKMVGDTTNE